ncbi:phosphoenolpyruvate--protein phosphotransferase [Candidatus Laterigemmans baculatus]|uniref:phosphoenolpyruvate--protein phosphotransferase n=1 Tax=Candidatus Laterigemmans baculatus TaxID=2770505 RepID=UPI0013DC44B0|nr:phosphoenolpyruvate--protein phosphotransferase [Candidatus Laterigemmans baculatus]
MEQFHGIPVSPGVAIGPAVVLDDQGYSIPRCHVALADVAAEHDRLVAAVAAVARTLETNRESTSRRLGDSTGSIFAAQLQMLHDPRLTAELQRKITGSQHTADYAVSQVMHSYASALRRLNNPLLAERAQDVLDIEKQLLQQLGAVTHRPLDSLVEPSVAFSHNLTPSETAGLDRTKVIGFATETGGPGGHTAIVAKGLELPAVVGIGPFLDRVVVGTRVIVDGDRGIVILDPDQATLDEYERGLLRRRELLARLDQLADLPSQTADGVAIELSANIEFPHEVAACLSRGADGIGLYRTEFLYLSREDEPTEQDHYEAYSEVVRAMQGRPVIIRTLDLGADKMGHRPLAEYEHNPCLGLRSIRLSLKNQDLFRPQLRAVLRAAIHGDVRLMFPMITTLGELRQARMLVNVVAEDLEEEGVGCRTDIPIGMMVEVPSAVLMLDRFIREVDFLSVGTNDLVQYTLAVDRSNEYVADLYQSSDPAVLRLILRAVEIADAHHVPLSVCGEMSSNPARALLLIGLGVRRLSVPPQALTKVKKAIRSVTIGQCREIAERVMTFEAAGEVDMYLMDRLSDLAPELIPT